VINAFWAYSNGFKPRLVRIGPRSGGGCIATGSDFFGHVFVYFVNEEGNIEILDNASSEVLGKDESVESYVTDKWPDHEISSDINIVEGTELYFITNK